MKKGKKLHQFCILLTFLLLLLFPAAAYGSENGGGEDEPALAPYFVIEGADPETDAFPLKETDVSASINGIIAETFVTQTYANEGQKPINARYLFPASDSVSIHGMKMQIGDQVITAKIQEREEAKETFQAAKEEGKSASLLEQQRPNVFSMDVANIMPGDTVRIELHYTEMVVSTEGIYEFVFPTVVGPRYAGNAEGKEDDPQNEPGSGSQTPNQWVATPYLEEGKTPPGKYNITVNLSTGVPLTSLSSKSHEVKIEKSSDSTATVTLAHPEDYAGNRDFILRYQLTGEEINSGLILDSDGEENYFMLMVQPPERYTSGQLLPREYIFVLDVSGSMYGYPLDTAKDLIRDLVSGLKESDRFNLLLFSNSSLQMSPGSVPATKENIQKAMDMINQESGGGGTELAEALREAVSIPMDPEFSRSVITITDGYISGEKEIFGIIHKNLGNTNFFSFGIGDSVNRYLIDGIAKAGQGEAFVVTDSEDAAETAERFRTYVQAPLLSDIKVDFDGFEAYDIEPPVVPTLFARRPIVLFGKWRGEQAGTIRITGRQGGEGDVSLNGTDGEAGFVQEIDVASMENSKHSQALRYLWARKKVERLMDYGSQSTDSKLTKKLVTAIGLQYSMMTPYTSFVAVTETVRNPAGEGCDVTQPSALPLHVSGLAVGGYTAGSEPGAWIFLLGTMLLILILVMRRPSDSLLARFSQNTKKFP
ncbi:VWA domain-containing protein [Clostridiaceae bacterium]|nr:VWA domain-containing protein [Clostridiaceae bacterium]RKI11081.1 VWA domain-containing protein [bacterium 1XD21-70]